MFNVGPHYEPWFPACQEIVELSFQVLYSVHVTEVEQGYLRIGELSQRTGVSPELLRAWERRYGLLRPERSEGGFRLYTAADEARIRRMRGYLARGIAAAEAARLADQAPEPTGPPSASSIEILLAELTAALDTYRDADAQRCLDAAFDTFTMDRVISDLLLPFLENLGERWERGEVSVAQEHFASNLVRSRLLGLARSWDAGYGPRAMLACPEGELHDLGLILFGIALNRRGWRITFLGANTPIATVMSTAEDVAPDAVVIAATQPRFLIEEKESLRELAGRYKLVVAGRGADGIAESVGAELFESDPLSAAERLAGNRP